MDEIMENEETEVIEDNSAQEQGEKLFTQEQVNEIVRKRLERQKEKDNISSQQLETREADLTAREQKLSCREYLTDMGYPAELLDILDTTDVEKFKEKADKSARLFGNMQQDVAPLANPEPDYGNMKEPAFADTKHVPKGYWATGPGKE